MNLHADVLIVTATTVESKAVVEVFQKTTGYVPKPTPVGNRVYHALGVVNGTSVFMVQSEMGSGGLGASQQTVQKGIAALSPIAVIMVGIAFGVNSEKQSLGDILISQQLMLYELQRVGTEKGRLKLIPRGDRVHASPRLLNLFRSAVLYWDDSKAKVHFGLILSGEKLVDNVDFRQKLRKLEPEAIGGEMEGAGLYVACQDAKVDWILVKAICDWADGHKANDKDEHQRLAAHNAASFVLHMLQQAPLKRKEGRQEPLTSTLSTSPSQLNYVDGEIVSIGDHNLITKIGHITVQGDMVLEGLRDLWQEQRGREEGNIAPSVQQLRGGSELQRTPAARRLRVFLCHAAEDKAKVRELYKKLSEAGVEPWLDEEELLPGQQWEAEIRRAIRSTDAVIVCLSLKMIEKTGYVQSEVRLILEAASLQPTGRIFLVPVRLELCPVPDQLSDWQWADLFTERGWERLLASLSKRASEIGASMKQWV
jgi:nucleoside phosphorylase